MAAPKGNQFWKLRSKHGVDKLFQTPELLWGAACEYFQWCDEHPWVKTETTEKAITLGEEKTPAEREQVKTTPIGRPYTITGFCLYCGCNSSWFRNFRDRLKPDESDVDKDFAAVVGRIEETIYTQKFEGAANGVFNANIIARDLGLRDKQDHEITGKNGGPIEQMVSMPPAFKTIEEWEAWKRGKGE